MGAALKAVGFTVETVQNQTAAQMKSALIAFQKQYQGTREVLFYFSGHGAQVAGESFLTPGSTAMRIWSARRLS